MTDSMESQAAEMVEPLIENNADEAVAEVSSTPFSHDADGAGGPNNNIMPVTLSWTSTKQYFSDLSTYYSPKFLAWLSIYSCFIGGGVFTLISTLSLPLFKGLGIGASKQQQYMSVVMAPWAMKPFIGVASDLLPIGGYNKRYIALFATLIGLAGCLALLGLAPQISSSEKIVREGGNIDVTPITEWIVVCFTAISYEAASLDILGEGKYAELMHLYPESGSSIISFKYGWTLLGSIAVQSFVGPMSDMGYFIALFWIALAFGFTPLLPTILGWIPEKKRSKDESGMTALCGPLLLFDRGTFQGKPMVFINAIICGLASPVLAAVTTYAGLNVGLILAAVIIVLFCCSTYFIFPTSFFWIFISLVLTNISSIPVSSALGYYYTATSTCVPGGPNFDYTFFITISGIVGSVMSFLSVLLYQRFLSTWRFGSAIILTLVISSFASIVDVILVMRWNLVIGIPDKVFFMFGNAIVGSIVITLQLIPYSALYAKLAPPGMESAVFAYNVGIGNFLSIVESLLGSAIVHWSGMTTVGDHCDFQALPKLIVLLQIIIPLVVGIPAVLLLIPNVLQTERLIDWEREGWANAAPVAEQSGVIGTSQDSFDEGSEQQLFLL